VLSFLTHPEVKGYIESFNAGGSRRAITKAHIESFRLPLPPLPEQRAIAHILGTLDDKIELNRRTNETLEAMARALFKSWFVDFDPVHTKKAGRKPVGMDPETAALFPDDFVESEIGPIPGQWAVKALGDVVTAQSGGTPSKQDATLWSGTIPWVSPKSMGAMHVDSSDETVAPSAIGNGTRLVPVNTTLVMVRGMGLHQSVRVSQALCDVTFNQDVKALVPSSIDETLLFFGMLDAQSDLLGRVETSGHGTGKLPSEILLSHRFVLPPEPIQVELAKPFAAINRAIAGHSAECRTLAALRDALLPQLLSGSLRVPEAMRLVEKAV
jgi:type I restriction enzyme, S subunit